MTKVLTLFLLVALTFPLVHAGRQPGADQMCKFVRPDFSKCATIRVERARTQLHSDRALSVNNVVRTKTS